MNINRQKTVKHLSLLIQAQAQRLRDECSSPRFSADESDDFVRTLGGTLTDLRKVRDIVEDMPL